VGNRQRLVDTFTAFSDDGKAFTLALYETNIDLGNNDNPQATSRGKRSLQTADGRAVRRVEKGVYEITGEPPTVVRSGDPNAP